MTIAVPASGGRTFEASLEGVHGYASAQLQWAASKLSQEDAVARRSHARAVLVLAMEVTLR
jgi:hypothetical protein